jgi:hypothetical protein
VETGFPIRTYAEQDGARHAVLHPDSLYDPVDQIFSAAVSNPGSLARLVVELARVPTKQPGPREPNLACPLMPLYRKAR